VNRSASVAGSLIMRCDLLIYNSPAMVSKASIGSCMATNTSKVRCVYTRV